MKKSLYLFFFTCSVLSMLSCEKYLDFEEENKTSKLVINTVLNSDSTFSVAASYSLGILDTNALGMVTTANVKVLDASGSLVEQLVHTGNGVYKGATKPVENQTYRVVASEPNYETVSGQDQVPSKINIITADTLGFVDADGDSLLMITLTFLDEVSTSDQYYLELGLGDIISGSIFESSISFTTEDLSIVETSSSQEEQYFSGAPFSDQLFNGTTKTLTVTIADTRSYDDFLTVNLSHISNSMYHYQVTYDAYASTFGNPFSQPVQVFSNIENGFGLVASKVLTRKKISY